MDKELRFIVQGSAPDPYAVTLNRVGDDLQTTCTCPAGRNRMYCKHRLSLLTGDFSAVVQPNQSDLTYIVQLLENSDVAAALQEIRSSELDLDLLTQKYSLKPSCRRRAVNEVVAREALVGGGFLKGAEGTHFLDVYDSSDHYCGSLNTASGVISEDLAARLEQTDVISVVREDTGHGRRCQALYAFLPASLFAKSLTAVDRLKRGKLRLKEALK